MIADAKTHADKPSHLYLVDGYGYVFRAYHALPPLTRQSDKLPVGAVQGFSNMLHKLREEIKTESPTVSHIGVVFDAPGASFRQSLYPDYKANRPPAPEDLVPQFPLTRRAADAFGIAVLEKEGLEADDIIAAYAMEAQRRGAKVSIVSSDKDLMQLVSKNIRMIDSMKDRLIDEEGVFSRFGVMPSKLGDLLALAGDSSDNIPGAPGIGPKTAAALLEDYGDLKTLLARAEEIQQPKRREALTDFADQIRLSRRLVSLKDDEIPQPLEALAIREPDPERLMAFLHEMEFRSLTRRVAKALDIGDAALPPPRPRALSLPLEDDAARHPIDRSLYQLIREASVLKDWVARARDAGAVAVDTETSSLDAMRADLVGISLALSEKECRYIPLLHQKPNGTMEDQIPQEEALKLLKPLLEDESVLKILHNAKYDMAIFRRHGIHLAPVDDTMLLSYALDGGVRNHGLDNLSRTHLHHEPIPYKEVAGVGKKRIPFQKVPLKQAGEYAAEDADMTLRLHRILRPRLLKERMVSVYETLERPLIAVLLAMEARGVRVEKEALRLLSDEFARSLKKMEEEIHQIAGEEFNIASPQQMGRILFEKLNLPGGGRTRTGQWSTRAGLLEELAAEGHEFPRRLLDWRHLAKLKSTYTDALPLFINPETGRVHTSYAMAAAATGRLASSDPNLQNIPIRTEEGRRIRKAFVAEEGHLLLSADYSQIELRLLAHIGGVSALREAFARGADIHAMTAAEIFGGSPETINAETRRRAKAINFGIIYGISAFGLARQLGIGRAEAADYIALYMSRFPGISDYMKETKARCRQRGYVETLFGRRCHLPGINDKNAARRGFSERAAINAPMQGSAADIIRRAMIRMDEAIREAGLKSRMLMQVHDELVFETPEGEADRAAVIIKEVMADAPLPFCRLSVPLDVDVHLGKDWETAH